MPWHTLEVTLLGRTFTLRTETEPEVFLKAVSDAEARLRNLETQLPGLSPYKAALLALILACEDGLEARRAMVDFRARVRNSARSLRESLGRPETWTDGEALGSEG